MEYDGSNGLVLLMDCSTIHVTQHDMALLGPMLVAESVIAYPNDYGAFVYVLNGEEKLWRRDGFSEHFCNVMRLAREKGATWVKFDADGFIHPDIKRLDKEWK
jgi:hypothetical protein